MTDSHIELIRQAIPLWYANVAWANELLVRAFGLAEPQDILSGERRHFQAIPSTCWFVRPHGVGVDIFKSPDVGGIDFDFDKPDPDEWRLALFIERQVNDGQLSYAAFRDLIDDEQLLRQAVSAALNGA
ncbi:DUF6896 domain-containing protein [Lysobacter niastensis]|uniref:DUF6896 domain-containing protein n=1 Tax=Lysobacter niastensis TaxID=380629 RepID=A0ABS0B9W3_9GAMM|nr:hypothetical protein [Lysobacter niastensis]MBF6025053.1 hypothetical protein [Lysobacter niastensis]